MLVRNASMAVVLAGVLAGNANCGSRSLLEDTSPDASAGAAGSVSGQGGSDQVGAGGFGAGGSGAGGTGVGIGAGGSGTGGSGQGGAGGVGQGGSIFLGAGGVPGTGGSAGRGGAIGFGGAAGTFGAGGFGGTFGGGGTFGAGGSIFGAGGAPRGGGGAGGSIGAGGDAGLGGAGGSRPSLLPILPGVHATPACVGCVDQNCNGTSACASNPRCVTGLVCSAVKCSANGATPDIGCLLACFGGDTQTATVAVSDVVCVYGVCGGPCTDPIALP
jgi:hypothetical protein